MSSGLVLLDCMEVLDRIKALFGSDLKRVWRTHKEETENSDYGQRYEQERYHLSHVGPSLSFIIVSKSLWEKSSSTCSLHDLLLYNQFVRERERERMSYENEIIREDLRRICNFHH